MKDFVLDIPTKIHFGKTSVDDALTKETSLFGDVVMIICTGDSLKKLGFLDLLNEKINKVESIKKVIYFDEVSANPDIEEIAKAIEIGKKESITSVIGFGGGSAIDAAKVVGFGVLSKNDIRDYIYKGTPVTGDVLPIISIPTTAGTGAELTKGAIVSSREKGIKTGIRGDLVTPVLAIVDPTFTYSVPYNITMDTGFDALTHAVESYLAVKADSFSEMLSEKAIKTISYSLRKLKENLNDYEARDNMSFSSMIMGFNVKNIGNCLPHRMQYPVGALTHTSHGAGLISLYPAWFGYEYEVSKEKVNEILKWLSYPEAKSAKEAKDSMRSFINEFGIYKSLTELGIESMDAKEIAAKVTGNLANDKLSEVEDIIETIYRESM